MSVSIRRGYILSTSFRAIRFQPRHQFPFSQDDVTSGKGRDSVYEVDTSAQTGTDMQRTILWRVNITIAALLT